MTICDLDNKVIYITFSETLVNADLTGTNLIGADLTGADLTGANLTGANLTGANLTGADLTGANLTRANVQNAVLKNASFVNVDLVEVRNLLSKQLSGTDLTNAKLPGEMEKFDETKHIDDRIKDTGKFFIALTVADIYSVLVLWSSRKFDVSLLSNTLHLKLPLFQEPVSVTIFCYLTPLILLAMYVYFHTELQHIWECIAYLPAIFPDGKPLHRHIYPWFVPGITEAFSPKLRSLLHSDTPSWVFMNVQHVCAFFLVWFTTPLALIVFWLLHIKLRTWNGTTWIVCLLSLSIVWGMMALHNIWSLFQNDYTIAKESVILGSEQGNSPKMLRIIRGASDLFFPIAGTFLARVYLLAEDISFHTGYGLLGLLLFVLLLITKIPLPSISDSGGTRVGVLKALNFSICLWFTFALFWGLSWGLMYSVPSDPNKRLTYHQNLPPTDARVWMTKIVSLLSITKYKPVLDLSNEVDSLKPEGWDQKDAAFMRKEEAFRDEITQYRQEERTLDDTIQKHNNLIR